MPRFRHVWKVFALVILVVASNGQAQGPLDDPQHCQSFDDTLFLIPSNSTFGDVLAADDFVADGTTLSQVRVWGVYYNYQDGDCAPPQTFDHFNVRILVNDPITGRMPDGVFAHAESTATSQHLAIDDTQIWYTQGLTMYQIDLTLEAPISGLSPGEVYWLEVSNAPTNSNGQPIGCSWYWNGKNQTSTSYFWFATPSGCTEGRPLPYDQAFCLNFPLGQSPVGAMPGACCTCDGLCTERTLKDCDDVDGIWGIERTSCDGVVCDTTPPNDNCADGPPLISEGFHSIPKRCTTTDGYGPIETDYGLEQIEGDTWYRFIAPPNCALTIDTCWTNASCFDSILAVYHNPDDPSVCPPCALMSDPNGAAISSATLAGFGQDESCFGQVSPDNGFWSDLYELGRYSLPGECFLIRVGSFFPGPQEEEGILHVACDFPPPPLEPDPSGFNKSRFISFQNPPQTIGQTAIRIQLTSLHHLAPCYIECAPPFTFFEGQYVWVGPPSEYVESSSTGTPFLASIAQCTPHYRDWSTVGLLHVTGSAIVPSSIYHVEQLASSCEGRENDSDCLPGGAHVSSQLQITTTRWGDVETPFNPPSATVQPDLADISALVNKFKSAPGAPIKARALLAGTDAFGTINIALDVGFDHISACVDAFRGLTYPYKMGKCALSTTACRTNFDCGSNGPCNLYCP